MERLTRRNLLGAAGVFAGGATLATVAGPAIPAALPSPVLAVEPECDVVALRAAVASIVAVFDVPLPAGDAGLIEAARRLPELRAHFKALYRRFPIDMEIEAAEVIPHADRLDDALFDFLIETEPQTLAGAAVMLRHALNEDAVLLNNGGDELVANVLALVERLSAGGAA